MPEEEKACLISESLEGAYKIKRETQAVIDWAESAEVIATLATFRDRYASEFVDCDTFSHTHYEIFKKYERLFVDMLEEYIRDELHIYDNSNFIYNLASRHDDNIILQAVLSVLDFEAFVHQMQRAQADLRRTSEVANDLGL